MGVARLVRVEVRRLLARRMTLVAVLVALVLIGVLIGTNAYNFRGHYVFTATAPTLIRICAALLALVALVIGASFVGAEWHHGAMHTLMTWEPRRLRLFTGKLVGLWIGSALLGLFVFGVALGINYLAARRFGSIGAMPSAVQRDLLLAGGRGLALALVGGAVGFAIAYATRLSSAALGVGLGYVVVGEIGVRLVTPNADRWLISTNVNAWLNDGTMVASHGALSELTLWQSGLYLGAITLGLLIVAAALFWRRDVA
ncbi:hypothetical protein [Fodinicola acaciae]|uniref:hypothetical protein n=1 Tax=Fodinicola acaciae TaxID=2681555 RepID=UPI0013D2B56B|nr:hypothetical protein [Fodinicola acaciae]